ncbi:hypothetical protein Sjap_012913 [Stephania japonica]|uniref:Uncharacterized protein n=1 Tax=Stephania japonica TaxID=461633 RepID=A0AAP0P0U7_9MAGN
MTITLVPTKLNEGKKTGTSGLRKKVAKEGSEKWKSMTDEIMKSESAPDQTVSCYSQFSAMLTALGSKFRRLCYMSMRFLLGSSIMVVSRITDTLVRDVAAEMEYKWLKLQEAVDWVVKNRLDGQAGMIAVSSEGEVAYRFNSNAMFRGCATEDGFMDVGIWE